MPDRASTSFADLLATEPTPGVDTAMQATGPDTIAKFLFTSGSTKLPKAVINTQGMWCANQQQMAQSMPVLTEAPPVLVDWLPWNHTFGGNHNFGMVIYHGGTMYIDDGKPTPALIAETIDFVVHIDLVRNQGTGRPMRRLRGPTLPTSCWSIPPSRRLTTRCRTCSSCSTRRSPRNSRRSTSAWQAPLVVRRAA